MFFHDGDGITEHFACCADGCHCAWEYGLDTTQVIQVRKP